MKTLILCVDRDDDVGVKGQVDTPVIGRRRNVEAALALGLADPEDSDTNAILAAVHVYDQQLAEGDDQIEVATVTGLRSLGIRGDRKLAGELDEVMEVVRPDAVVLVSDGAEDERILPLLQSRCPVVHVHRSVVKQAPRLEGFFYVLTRILDDPRQSRRFVLPLGILTLFWAAAYAFGFVGYAGAATLGFVGAWLFIHGMKWEKKVGQVFKDLGDSLRSGLAALLANLLAGILLVLGVVWALDTAPAAPTATLHTLHFLRAFLPFVVSALLVHLFGRFMHGWLRGVPVGLGAWMAVFVLVAFLVLMDILFQVTITTLEGRPLSSLVEFEFVLRTVVGVAVALGAIIVGRYLRSFGQEVRA